MKMTMHIDEALLERVMAEYGFASKTEAVEAALKEMDRQMRIREFRTHGLGVSPEELGAALYPGYRVRGEPAEVVESLVAEDAAKPAHGHPAAD